MAAASGEATGVGSRLAFEGARWRTYVLLAVEATGAPKVGDGETIEATEAAGDDGGREMVGASVEVTSTCSAVGVARATGTGAKGAGVEVEPVGAGTAAEEAAWSNAPPDACRAGITILLLLPERDMLRGAAEEVGTEATPRETAGGGEQASAGAGATVLDIDSAEVVVLSAAAGAGKVNSFD